MIGIIVPPMPSPMTNSASNRNEYDVSALTWVNIAIPTTMVVIPAITILPGPILSVRIPATGMVSIAPRPCGASSSPARSVVSSRTCRK
jgi:hypothetical protein